MTLVRKQELNNTTADNSVIIQAGGDIVFDETLYKELFANRQNLKLFNRFIKEKTELCRKDILNKNTIHLKKTLDTIFNYGLSGIDDNLKQILYFYRFISGILDKNIRCSEDSLDNLEGEYYKEAAMLMEFERAPHLIEYGDYDGLCAEVQLVILDLLFEKGFYANVEALYFEEIDKGKNDAEILTYYYGLSAFNLNQFENACNALKKVQHLNIDVRIPFLQILASAQIELLKFNNNRTNLEELKRIFCNIQEQRKKDISVLTGCELVAALTEAQIGLWISPDTFMEVFNSYGPKIQEDPNMQFFLGLYYEACNENERAVEIYSSGDWKNNEEILYRLLYVNLLSGKNDKILQLYGEASNVCRTAPVVSLWLSALKETSPKEYDIAVREEAGKYKNNLKDLFYIMLAVDDKREIFDELFIDKIMEGMGEIKNFDFQKRLGYARILIRYEYAELCIELLDSIKDGFELDDETVYRFYVDLNRYKAAKIGTCGEKIPDGEVMSYLEYKIRICDWFLKNNKGTELFLKEKINCLILQKKKISLLSCTKQLYEVTHEEDVAANVIALLLECETTSKDDYEYYIYALKNTRDPRCLIAVAAASSRIGKIEAADFYSYKAIFMLNGKEDFDIFKNFFWLHNEMIYEHRHSVIEPEEVVANTVLTLSASCLQEEAECVDLLEKICLDSEAELEEAVQDNISMGIRHFCSRDPIYLRLLNKKPGQKISINGMEYVVKGIIDRGVYAYRYVLDKLARNPDKSNMIAVSTRDASIETLWEEMKKAIHDCQTIGRGSEETEGKEDIYLNLYHFRNNALGLPIDVLTQKNYDNYIDVIYLLLFGKDQALYAGWADTDISSGQKIVVTLPTLTILCQMKKLDLLNNVADQIVIPISLTEFLRIRVKKAVEMQAVSPGKLMELPDGSPALLSFDNAIVDMWNMIYEFCLQFEQIEVTDKDRTEFDISGGVNAETIFSSLYIDRIQMDCMVLAKRLNAVYLCDDLFFRNMAAMAGIKSTNFTKLIYLLENKEEQAKFCMELSKTNYIYAPLIYQNMEEVEQMWECLMDGDIKREYYGPIIRNLVQNAVKKVFSIQEQ